MNILYIEDNKLNADVVKAFIEYIWNITIDVAETAEIGLEKIRENKFDLVLMDINLPGIDGIEATRRIRERLDFISLPIIMVSANADENTKILSQEVGANGYITKPVMLDVLEKQLRGYIV